MTMPFEQAAAWGQGGFEARGDRDEARVRRDFWRKAARVAARLPFAEGLLAAYYCAFDHATQVKVKAMLVGALAYFVRPVDAFPYMLPPVAFTTDTACRLAPLRSPSGPI